MEILKEILGESNFANMYKKIELTKTIEPAFKAREE